MSYDNVLTVVGESGPYYKRVWFLLSFVSVFSGFPVAIIVFPFHDVSFRCSVPSINDTFYVHNEAHQRLVNASIPYDVITGLYSQCFRYSRPDDKSSNETTACDAWVFDPDLESTSIVPELKMVCDREHYKAHFTLVFLLGFVFAAFSAGPVADTFGRKRPMIAFALIQVVAMAVFPLTTNLPLMFFLMWITGGTTYAYFIISYTLLIEITGPSKRAWAGLGPMIAWSSGLCLTVPYFYLVKDWRMAVFVIAGAGLYIVVYCWFVPESPRWLLARNRTEEAHNIFKVMAKVNKVTLPEELELTYVVGSKIELNQGKLPLQELKPLFADRVLVLRVFVLSFIWFALNIVYSATTYSVGSMIEGDIYINFLMQAIMESLSYILGFFLLRAIGRRVLLCGYMMLSGMSYLANAVFQLMNFNAVWIPFVTYGVGKFGITGGFMVIFVQANEVMPTVVRNSAVGLCSFMGQCGAIIAPYLVILDTLLPNRFGKALPLLIFSICSIISGFLTLLLPETRDRKLPDTIQEAKDMGRRSATTKPSDTASEC